MNPVSYLTAFAWIAIVGLGCMIFMDYWIPILVGTVVLTVLLKLVSPLNH